MLYKNRHYLVRNLFEIVEYIQFMSVKASPFYIKFITSYMTSRMALLQVIYPNLQNASDFQQLKKSKSNFLAGQLRTLEALFLSPLHFILHDDSDMTFTLCRRVKFRELSIKHKCLHDAAPCSFAGIELFHIICK